MSVTFMGLYVLKRRRTNDEDDYSNNNNNKELYHFFLCDKKPLKYYYMHMLPSSLLTCVLMLSGEKKIHWLNMRLPVFAFSVIHELKSIFIFIFIVVMLCCTFIRTFLFRHTHHCENFILLHWIEVQICILPFEWREWIIIKFENKSIRA